jgi:ABC-type phosphate transport system auxiliary subunit
MAMYNNLSEIEARCTEVNNSPYMRRELPPELLKLRVLLTKVEKLTRDDVPALINEIKRLRSQNKRLEAEAEATHVAFADLEQLDQPEQLEQLEQIEQIETIDQPEPIDHVDHVDPQDLDHEALITP